MRNYYQGTGKTQSLTHAFRDCGSTPLVLGAVAALLSLQHISLLAGESHCSPGDGSSEDAAAVTRQDGPFVAKWQGASEQLQRSLSHHGCGHLFGGVA